MQEQYCLGVAGCENRVMDGRQYAASGFCQQREVIKYRESVARIEMIKRFIQQEYIGILYQQGCHGEAPPFAT